MLLEVTWAEAIQALAAIITSAIAGVGLALLYDQVAQAKRTLNSMAHAALYAHTHSIIQLFVEYGQYREYFYGGRECSPDNAERPKLLSITDTLIDSFEHIVQQRTHLPVGIWPAWVRYMRSISQTSPLLRA